MIAAHAFIVSVFVSDSISNLVLAHNHMDVMKSNGNLKTYKQFINEIGKSTKSDSR